MSHEKPFQLEDRYLVIKRSDLGKVFSNLGLGYSTKHAFDAVIRELGRVRNDRGSPPLEGIFIEKDWPEYWPALAAIEARVNGEEASEPKHWYLVSWAGDRERGCTEVPCTLPLAAGDMLGLIAYLTKQNPTAGVISIQGVFPLAPKRAEPEAAKPANPEPAAEPEAKKFDLSFNGKLVRVGASEDEAWDLIDKRSSFDTYLLTDSKTGITVSCG